MNRRYAVALALASAVSSAPAFGQVIITGNSDQSLAIIDSMVLNKAVGLDSAATQNIATNAGKITIRGESLQNGLIGPNVLVSNLGIGWRSEATQNVASNSGQVLIGAAGKSLQIADMYDSSLLNSSIGLSSTATQSTSSNFGDVVIYGTSKQVTVMLNGIVSNVAAGVHSSARQNLATNTSCGTGCR